MPSALDIDSRLSPDVRAHTDEVVSLRRDFHRHPELLFDLPWTSARVTEYLKGLDLEVRTGIGKAGVVGVLKGGKPGPTVLYRADMDGLPLQEETGLPFASENPGRMHACGHDGHTAVALVMAKLLARDQAALPGRIAFLFQPAEEGGDGAGAMIQDGVLDWLKPDTCYAMHLINDEPIGTVGVRAGGVFAGSNEFVIRLSSRGGHGASPHEAPDLVLVASHIVTALQSVVSRSVDPRESAVVTVGLLHAGTKSNILPTSALLEGTVRTFDRELAWHVAGRVEAIARGIAAMHGAGIEYEFQPNYPPTINDPKVTEMVGEVARDVVGAENVKAYWTTGSEDMSRFLEKVPGCYYTVGSGKLEREKTFAHHSGHFDIEEPALPLAVELGVRVLRRAVGA
jgi:amidohydrolase